MFKKILKKQCFLQESKIATNQMFITFKALHLSIFSVALGNCSGGLLPSWGAWLTRGGGSPCCRVRALESWLSSRAAQA